MLKLIIKKIQEKTEVDSVVMYQTRTKARIIIEKKGDVDITGPKLKQIFEALAGS